MSETLPPMVVIAVKPLVSAPVWPGVCRGGTCSKTHAYKIRNEEGDLPSMHRAILDLQAL